MKNITKLILPAALLLFVLAVTGYPQHGKPSGTENQGTNPAVPQSPIELTEAELLSAFSLVKGSITASAAAKKIATGTPAGGITFTQKTAVSYDDQAGTFTVKIKGTKSGRPFEKTFNLTSFTHPLAGKTIQSLDACELNLDDAIEHNYSLEKYITEVNKDPSGKKLVKKLSFMLNDGTTPIELGEHDGYTLTAKAQATGTQVWVQPKVKIVFRKLTEGGTETLTDSTPFGFTHLKTQLTKDYFTEQDVFAHVLSNTNDTVIKVHPSEFASSFYAAAKSGNSTKNLFDTSIIPSWTTRYQTKDADEYMQLDITCGISNPKNGGINADDYEGELTVRFCIATQEQLANQGEITAIKTITRSGYAKITNAEELKNQLFFDVSSKPNPSAEAKKNWKRKQFDRVPLLRIGDEGAVVLASNPLPDGPDKPFCLCVNGESTLSNHLGCKVYGASKTRNNKVIFIENIQLQKTSGETNLQVKVQLKGSGSVLTLTMNPGEEYR